MAEIDNLDFKVILDDAKFNAQIDADIKTAERLNIRLSELLTVKNKLNSTNSGEVSTAKSISSEMTKQVASQEKMTQAKLNSQLAQTKLNNEIDRGNKGMSTQSRILRQLSTVAAGYFSVRGIASFLSSLYRITGEFDLQRTALKSILNDGDKATQIFGQLKELAVQSPFTLQELTRYTKQLTAFSIPTDELFQTNKMLADVAAGLGVSMDRVVLAFGQVKSAAFLRGQEVRQFTEAGIPILDILAQQLSAVEGRIVSVGEVFDKISARQVTFDMVKQAFVEMTSEGGKFYNMQEVLSETLAGKIMKLKDYYQIVIDEMGSANSGVLKGSVDLLISIIKNFDTIGKAVVDITAGFGAYGAVLAAVALRSKSALMLEKWEQLSARIGKARAAMVLLQRATGNAFGASIGIATTIGLAIWQIVRSATELNREINKIAYDGVAASDSLQGGLDSLVKKLSDTTFGTQGYKEAIEELNSKYGDYLPNLLSESSALDDVRIAADAAAEAIRRKSRATAEEKGVQAITDKYGDRYASGVENFAKEFSKSFNIDGKAISESQANAFANYFTANVNKFSSIPANLRLKKMANSYFGGEVSGNFGTDTAIQEIATQQVMSAYEKIRRAKETLSSKLDILFSDTYLSDQERKLSEEINARYESGITNAKSLSPSDYATKSVELYNQKLRETVEMWEKLGRTDMVKQAQSKLDAATKMPEGWQGKVDSTLTGMGVKKGEDKGMWATDSTNYFDYFEKLTKRYSEIQSQIPIAADPATIASLKSEKSIIEAIMASLGKTGYLNSGLKSNGGKSEAQKEIESKISTLREIKELYDQLQPYVGQGTMNSIISKEYGGSAVSSGMDYDKQLNDLINQLSRYDSYAAQSLTDSITKGRTADIVRQYEDSAKALEEFDAVLKDVMANASAYGEGIGLDISKIIAKQRNSDTEINNDAEDKIKKLAQTELEYREKYGEQAWRLYSIYGENAIKQWAAKQKQANHDVAQDSLNELATNYVNDTINKSGIDLNDLSDKNIGQLTYMISELSRLSKDGVLERLVPQELKTSAASLGLTFENLYNTIRKIFKSKITDISVEKLQKIATIIGDIADTASNIGSTLDNMGGAWSAIGTVFTSLGKLGSALKSINTEMAKAKANGGKLDTASKVSLVGSAIQNVVGIISLVSNQIEENKELQDDWNDSVRQCAHEYTMLKLNDLDYSQSNIFGSEDPLKKAIDGMKQYNESLSGLIDLKKQLEENGKVQVGTANKGDTKNTLSGAGMGAAAGALVGSVVGPVGTVVGGVIGSVAGMVAGFFGGKRKVAVYDTLVNQYEYIIKLTDEGYQLNEKIVADYEKMDDDTKALIDNWDEIKKVSDEAMDNIKDNLADIAGEIDDKLQTALIDAFNSGDTFSAIDDFHDYVSSVIQDLMKQALFAALFKKDLEAFQQRMIDSLDPTSEGYDNDITDDITDFYDTVVAKWPQYQKALQLLKDKTESMGLEWDAGDSSSSSLSNDIKSLTEDTGGLLASYINAIRADVSFNKTQLDYIRTAVVQMNSSLDSLPILSEYMANVDANTTNIAIDTHALLLQIKSVISIDTGVPAINVSM